MKPNVPLVVLSILSVLLFLFHVTDDFARGLDTPGPQNAYGLLISGTWLFGALGLPGRRSGTLILLLGAILGVGVVVLHMQGARYPAIAATPDGYFFVWTLWVLGTSSIVSIVLAARSLWGMRPGQPR
jgi:hypothetical protein